MALILSKSKEYVRNGDISLIVKLCEIKKKPIKIQGK